jgi:triosephosphate isomerase
MNPNIILAEAPELIGAGIRSENDQQLIQKINQTVWDINPEILVLHGAGISNGSDVYQVIHNGAQATGSTSGIILAEDPFAMVEEMISNVRRAWDEIHNG